MKGTNYFLIGIVVLISACSAQNQTDSEKLYPVANFLHAHGLATDPIDSGKLYIATHHGLYLLVNETKLFQIGKSEDDYMGFSPHPSKPNIVYTSGHPIIGGNLGFQKSEDGGFTWKKISDGVNGPVDFHAMSVSKTNPKTIYGWYQGNVQRSDDEGKTWNAISQTTFPIVSLETDSRDENRVYAASPLGMYISNDKGISWNIVEEFKGKFVSSIASSQNKLLVFSGKLMKSSDDGATWTAINESFNNGTVLYIAFDRQDNSVIYGLTNNNEIFKSNDDGKGWKKIY